MRKPPPPLVLGPDGLPERLRWRPVIEVKGLLFGALFTLGSLVLLQQLGATTLDIAGILAAIGLGVLVGIAVPSLGRLWGVVRANKLLRQARAEKEGHGVA